MDEEMTAVVLHEPGDMRLEQVAVPTPDRDEVLVKVSACGVCGSDIARMNYSGAHRHPIICGHEFAGHVVGAGAEVTSLAVGDLVAVPPLIPCGKCSSCLAGNFSLCEDYDYFGSRRDGAYAEYVTVPAGNTLLVPATMDPRAAAMLDPAAIALHAIWKTNISEKKRVAVIGAGPIGLFAVQWARFYGAKEVLAVDVDDRKASLAREAGATYTAASGKDNASVVDTFGEFDVVIESAGASASIAQAIELVARHGEAAFIGIPHSPVNIPEAVFSGFQRREVSLHGSWNSFSAPFPGAEWTTAAEKIASGEIGWKFMITHELGLRELPRVMKELLERSIFSSKILFIPDSDGHE